MNRDRLIEAMKRQGLNQSELARLTGVTQGAVNQLVTGRAQSSRFLPAMARVLGVSVDWLQGEDVAPGVPMTRPDVSYVRLTEIDVGYGMGGGTFIDEVPIHTSFRVFDPKWLREVTQSPPEKLFIARGVGDSMMPTLLDNDTLLVDRGQTRITQQDRIWALTYGELGMIKRVRRLPSGRFSLMSDNPNISPVDATEDEIHVVGRIVWVGRKT